MCLRASTSVYKSDELIFRINTEASARSIRNNNVKGSAKGNEMYNFVIPSELYIGFQEYVYTQHTLHPCAYIYRICNRGSPFEAVYIRSNERNTVVNGIAD